MFVRLSLIAIIVYIGSFNLYPQRFESHQDSLECLRNYSLYVEYYRIGEYERALPFWRLVFENYPDFSRNIYIHGEVMLDEKIGEAESPEIKAALLDTAMMMFDRRLERLGLYEHLGDSASVLGRKGQFFFRHNNIVEEAGPGYEALGKAIEMGNITPPVVALYMNVTVSKFFNEIFEAGQVIDTYLELTGKIDNALAVNNKDVQNLTQARDIVENLFIQSRAAGCDVLIEVFSERVENEPDNEKLISMVNDLLDDNECRDSDLYYYTTEKLHELNPTARSAMNLSRMYRSVEDLDRTIVFLKQAIELEENRCSRSGYYFELAELINRTENNPEQVRIYARKAIEDDENNAQAYMLIGQLYTEATQCFEDEFKKQTIYWAAVDQFTRAKNADPSIAELAYEYIKAYSARFPNRELLFFHGYEEGQTFIVDCWINERTIVRAR